MDYRIIILWSGDDGEIYCHAPFLSRSEAKEWVEEKWQGEVDYNHLPPDVIRLECSSSKTCMQVTTNGGAI
jgi:hypothetical protein